MYFHYNATDEEPTHNFCKVDWCPYKQAVAKGTVNDYKHTSCLPKAVMNAIKPVFKDLASTQLLEKCLVNFLLRPWYLNAERQKVKQIDKQTDTCTDRYN